MGELLDRAFQLQTLRELAAFYPEGSRPIPREDRIATVNIFYLMEHGLIEAKVERTNAGRSLFDAKITAKGLDFLADDGGLSAILGIITVRLHDDTIRALLVSKVEASDADATTKGQLIAAIRALPAEALTKLAEKAMDSGLDQLPQAIELLRGWIGL